MMMMMKFDSEARGSGPASDSMMISISLAVSSDSLSW